MLFKRRATHVLWVFWDAEFDGDNSFLKLAREKANLRSNQVKLGQSHNSKLSYKHMPIVFSVLLIPKMSFTFISDN